MPILSLFVAKLTRINENDSSQDISESQYTFMPHIPLKTGFNHNIHWYKGPEIKIQAIKSSQKDKKNAKFVTICRKIGKKQ